MFQAFLAPGVDAQIGKRKGLQIRTLVDGSSSIWGNDLKETVAESIDAFEHNVARTASHAFLPRSIFWSEHLPLDEDAGEDQSFLTVHGAVKRPFSTLYHTGRGTSRNRFLNHEVQRLLNRFDADRHESSRHLLVVTTDAQNTGPIRGGAVRFRMESVHTHACRAGGIEHFPIVVWYWGVGMTLEARVEQAHIRYGIPQKWVMRVPATQKGVRYGGSRLNEATTRLSDGGHTVITELVTL